MVIVIVLLELAEYLFNRIAHISILGYLIDDLFFSSDLFVGRLDRIRFEILM